MRFRIRLVSCFSLLVNSLVRPWRRCSVGGRSGTITLADARFSRVRCAIIDNLAVSAQGFRRGANRVRKQMVSQLLIIQAK